MRESERETETERETEAKTEKDAEAVSEYRQWETLRKESMSPTAGMKSGMNGFSFVSNSISLGLCRPDIKCCCVVCYYESVSACDDNGGRAEQRDGES